MARPRTPPPASNSSPETQEKQQPRRKRNWSPHTRTRIAVAREFGLPYAEIARREGVSARAAAGIVRRYRHQTKGEDLPRPGRPKLLLTAREQRHVLRLVEGTAGLSKAQIIQQAGLAVSETTLARFLKEQGVKQRCLKFKKAANSKTASNMG